MVSLSDGEMGPQVTTSMHGSSEGHTAYIYEAQRPGHAAAARPADVASDPLCAEGIALLRGPPSDLFEDARKRLDKALEKTQHSARPTRACREPRDQGAA